MSMMQQLLQAMSADGGQQKDESGGTGRGNTNDNSGGARRAPREGGAAGARIGDTITSTAGGRVSNLSSRAFDRSGPTDGTDRRPQVPAGVGPMTNIQRGETRDLFLASIAAHDGGRVLSSSFQRQLFCAVPPVVLREEK